MKKSLLLFLLSLSSCLGMNAQGTQDSDGILSVEDAIMLVPGAKPTTVDDEDNYCCTISFDDPDGNLYTAYQMNIYLPDGFEFFKVENDDEIQVFAILDGARRFYKSSHSIKSEIQSDGSLLVLVASLDNLAFGNSAGTLFDFYIKATPYAKPGDFQVTIKNAKFVRPDETKYLYKDQVLTAGTLSAESTLPLKVTSAQKISTAIFPFSCDVPDGLEVYAATGIDGEYITLGKQESIAAFTPYILYAENSIDQTLQGIIDAANYPASTSVSDGFITGVLCDTQVSAGYVLQNKGVGPKFYKIGNTPFSIPAGKCYANAISYSAPAFSFLFGDDDVDGIQSTTALPTQSNGKVYDLQGKEVFNPQSGQIYIINGQKVLKR